MSTGKVISYGTESQTKIIEGVNKVADAVKVSLGPAGAGVCITNDFSSPEISRDGATIAKAISFSDDDLNAGARLIKDAASLSESQSGDSTTTTILLIQELIKKGQKAISTGSNVNELKSGMIKAEKWVIDYIKKFSTSVDGDFEKIRKVATISANNNSQVGDLIVDCMQKVGENGIITADLGSGLDYSIDVTTGMKINRGWCAPIFVTSPEEGKCILDNPYIIVVDERLSSVNQILPAIQRIQTTGNPFLIICDEIDENVLALLAVNNTNGAFRCCIVKGIDFGDNRKNVMQDIACATGATFITADNNVHMVDATDLSLFGTAKKVVISRDSTIILEGAGNKDDVKKRVEILQKLCSTTKSDFDKSKFKNRIASLAGGVAIIKVGGSTQVEQVNAKQTVEDAILASKSAVEEGVVPGSGYVYVSAFNELINNNKISELDLVGDEIEGAKIVASSLPIIMDTVVRNAGASVDLVKQTVLDKIGTNYGFDAKSKKFCTLTDSGILDSAKCIRVALENAVSTASMILTIGCTITNEPVNNNDNKTSIM